MRKKGLWKKSASILMAAAMIMTSVPVYAAEAEEQPGEAIVQEASEEAAEDAQEVSLEEAAGEEAVTPEVGETEGGGQTVTPEEGGAESGGQETKVVAKIGETPYTSLSAAIDAVPDGTDTKTTIVLQSDATGGVKIGEKSAKNIELDLKV